MGSKFIQNFQAYGEVIWFGGKVTALTFVSFVLMVSRIESILWLRNLIVEKVISSIIAAWSDVTSGLSGSLPAVSTVSLNELQNLAGAVRGLNIGYFWMFVNCLTSAAYVRIFYICAVNDGRYTRRRCFPCGNVSKLLDSLTGTPCFTITCSAFQSSPFSLSLLKTGGPKTWLEICKRNPRQW